MNFIKRILGKIIYGLSRFIDVVLGLIIDILDVVVNIIYKVGRGILGFALIFLMLIVFFPLGLLFLSPIIIQVIFIFLVIPWIAKYLSKGLTFLKYVLTEYLYDKSNYLIDGTKMRFDGIGKYAEEYRRKQEEKRQAEEKRRQEERRRFEENMRNAWSSSDMGGFQGGQSGTGSGGFGNVGFSFKDDYEKACDVLDIDYNATQDEIRKAYRLKAKEFHPDLNKSEGATEMFQKVNDAHDFLNEANINRYKNMS